MQIHFGLELLHAEWHHCVTCVGTFDGVHLGHQAVIRTAVQTAVEAELPCCLVTFDRHPAHVLAPDRCPKAISSLSANLDHFTEIGVSVAVILAFDPALSRMSATDFLDHILVEKLRTNQLVVGHDFAMGHHREGTSEWLAQHIPTRVVPPYELDGRRVSSSDVRRAIEAGRIEDANRWLGRPFEIDGVVVGGERLGRTIGFPTANLARSFDQIYPADGVYAAMAEGSFGRYAAAVSIGMRPAVGGKHRTIEAYLIDYPGESLYGKTVRLSFHHRLREELDFPSLDALKAQIAADVLLVSERLS